MAKSIFTRPFVYWDLRRKAVRLDYILKVLWLATLGIGFFVVNLYTVEFIIFAFAFSIAILPSTMRVYAPLVDPILDHMDKKK